VDACRGEHQRQAGALLLTRRKKVAFAALACTSAFAAASAGLLAVDVYLHHRFERSAGFNVWGYRGPHVGRKLPGEYRVAVVGGSTAYGYGVTWEQAFPAQLQRELAGRGTPTRFTVINLGYNNEGAYSFKPTLQDYGWLDYDLALLYEGYNDLAGDIGGSNVSLFRHDSPIFRLTGYLPIFPIVFKEKAAAMLSGGDAGSLYRDARRPRFRPGLATRAAADVLTTVADIGQVIERQMGAIASEPPHEIDDVLSTGCKAPWREYCRSVLVAVDFALGHGKGVIVATQPYEIYAPDLRLKHIEQQGEMRMMLERHFEHDRRVRYVSFGGAIDLHDAALSFDGMHLTESGNRRIAASLVDVVLEMAGTPRPTRP
jgi:hypothetical protein